MEKFKLQTGGQSFELSVNDINELDVSQQEGNYHCLSDGISYKANVESIANKTITLSVNHTLYEVNIADIVDQQIEEMGLNKVAETILKDIKAPMPGLILDIMVEVGQEVNTGDALLILEAMKMENIIKATGQGVVKEIKLSKGAAVDKNQIIIEMV